MRLITYLFHNYVFLIDTSILNLISSKWIIDEIVKRGFCIFNQNTDTKPRFSTNLAIQRLKVLKTIACFHVEMCFFWALLSYPLCVGLFSLSPSCRAIYELPFVIKCSGQNTTAQTISKVEFGLLGVGSQLVVNGSWGECTDRRIETRQRSWSVVTNGRIKEISHFQIKWKTTMKRKRKHN